LSDARWRIQFTVLAELDIKGLIEWTQNQFGAAQARRYRELIFEVIEELELGPRVSGSVPRDEIFPGSRTLHMARRGRRARHLILYRVIEPNTIEILRVLHDAMDIGRHVPDTDDC
jgi:toxin ParE1/3/4